MRHDAGKALSKRVVNLARQTLAFLKYGSLARLFEGQAPTPRQPTAEPVPSAPSSTAELIQRANEHYQRALAAQRAGDWARYGEEMRLVGEVLRALQAAAGGGSP